MAEENKSLLKESQIHETEEVSVAVAHEIGLQKDKFKDYKELSKLLKEVKNDASLEWASKIEQYEKEEDFKKIRRKYKKALNESTNLGEKPQKEDIDSLVKKCEKFMTENKEVFENYVNLKFGYKSGEQEREKLKENNSKLVNNINTLETLFKTLKKNVQKEHDDYTQMMEIERNKTKELIDSLQGKIKELQPNYEAKNIEVYQKQKENELLKEKMQEVSKEIESKYELFESELKKKEVESQTQETQFLEKLSAIEQQAGPVEQFREKLEEAKKKESATREKLDIYLKKCQDFQTAMALSNDFFDRYKKDMEKMAEKIKKIEINIMNSQKKCEKSDMLCVDQLEDYLKLKAKLSDSNRQLETLNSLERSLKQKLAEKIGSTG